MAEAESNLQIKSNPSSAVVTLEGDRVGTTPLQTTVGSDEINLSVVGQGTSMSSPLKLDGNLSMTVNLDSIEDNPPYRVLVLSKPNKASVTVDGEPRGRTPWTGTLSTGRHTFEITKKGHRRWTAEIAVNSALSMTARLSRGEQKEVSSEKSEKPTSGKRDEPTKKSKPEDSAVQKTDDNVQLVMPVDDPEPQVDESPEYEQYTPDKDLGEEPMGTGKNKQKQDQSTKPDSQADTMNKSDQRAKKDEKKPSDEKSQSMAEASDEEMEDTGGEEMTKKKTPERTASQADTSPTADTPTMKDQKMAEKRAKKEREKQAKKTRLPETIPLKVESSPNNAKLYIDGQEMGKTPFVRKEFDAGTSTIRLTRDGYKVWEETFFLDEPTQLKIKMKPQRAYLSLKPDPATMKVSIGNQTFEVDGPQTFKIKPGSYDLSAMAEGYDSYDTTVNLEKGAKRTVDVSLSRVPKLWEYPTTRDVFLRMARNHLGDLVESFGIDAGNRLAVVPDYDDWAHNLMDDVLTVVMNRNAILVVDSPSTRASNGSLDREFKFYIVEMDVTYDSVGSRNGVQWLKRHFDLKINAKLIHHETGEVQYTKFFHRTGEDRIPAKFKDELRQPYEPPETEPPLVKN